MQGQINIDTELGLTIYNYSKQKNIKNILDIGTWNGYGSTMCIIKGIIDSNKKDYNFISVESDYKQALLAQSNLENYSSYVKLMFGTIADVEDLVSLNDYGELFYSEYPRSLQEQWLKAEVEQYNSSPCIYDQIIDSMNNNIDLLILDGGEYGTNAEFNKLKDISKIIILDDTTTIKNYKNAQTIRNSNGLFSIINDDINVRKGIMVAKNESLLS